MHPLFTNCKDLYKKYLIIKNYKKGSLIFNEGEICKYLSLIINGIVSISTINHFFEYEIAELRDGNLFGENLLFSEQKKYLGDIIAIKDTTIAFITKDNLFTLLKNNTILENYLHLLSKKAMNNQLKLKILSQKSIKEKVLFYLNSEQKRTNSNTILIDSKEQLSKILNVPRPSLSRELINLKNDNIIDFGRHFIKII